MHDRCRQFFGSETLSYGSFCIDIVLNNSPSAPYEALFSREVNIVADQVSSASATDTFLKVWASRNQAMKIHKECHFGFARSSELSLAAS